MVKNVMIFLFIEGVFFCCYYLSLSNRKILFEEDFP